MQTRSCPCGNIIYFSSMGFPRCRGCPKCGKNVYGDVPTSHNTVIKYDQNTGRPYGWCETCYERVEMVSQ